MVATPKSSINSLTGGRHVARDTFAGLLVDALMTYAKLSEDQRPPVGTCVLIQRGRDHDVRGTVLGYDVRGVAVEARFAFVGLQRVYLPWSAIRAMIEVPA